MRFPILLLLITGFAIAIGIGNGGNAGTVIDRYDHFSTGFPLEGRHAEVACESCHAQAVFKGTPRMCARCHNNILAEGMGLRHIPVNRSCESCHNVQDWRLARYDHIDLGTTCTRCHNNYLAPGKTANHPFTNNICADCHNTVHWDQILPTAPAT